MTFPQGGDFPRNVGGSLVVVKSDRRICAHDNGTTVCDKGHKLKFAGTCFNQNIGTFNSTDNSFQPTFPICTIDYESSGFSGSSVFTAPSKTSGEIIALFPSSTSGGTVLSKLDQTRVATHGEVLVPLQTTGSAVIANLTTTFTKNTFVGKLNPLADARWRMAQFNPGALIHNIGVTSDTLFPLDVIDSMTSVNRQVLFFVETIAATVKSSGDTETKFNEVTSDYYTTISGKNDICVGDSEPPFIQLVSPTTSGMKLAPTTQNIDFSVVDLVAGVDISSVFVTLYSIDRAVLAGSNPPIPSGIPLVENGTDVTGGDVAISGDVSSGYRITYAPPFVWNENETVRVTVSGTDLPLTVGGNPFFCSSSGVNVMSEEFDFQVLNQVDLTASAVATADTTAPIVTNTMPASGTIGNSVFDPLSLSVTDDLTGVDLSSLNVTVGTTQIVTAGIPNSAETAISGTPLQYDIVYTPVVPFTYGTTQTVTIVASDRQKPTANTLGSSYTVGYTPSSTLIVENFVPSVGTSNDLGKLLIEADVRDDSYGVDINSTDIIVNNTLVASTKVATTSGVHISYHPPNNFRYGQPIQVVVHAVNNNTTAPVVKDVKHTLYYGYNVLHVPSKEFSHTSIINVFVKAANTELVQNSLAKSYPFTTYTQPSQDLGASVVSINPTADLSASVSVVAPEHRYGETVTVEFFVKDLSGHELGPVSYTYTIENK